MLGIVARKIDILKQMRNRTSTHKTEKIRIFNNNKTTFYPFTQTLSVYVLI